MTKEALNKIIELLEDETIETLGLNKKQFIMDKEEYSNYHVLTLNKVKEILLNIDKFN